MNIAVVGLGLIGGSFEKASRAAGHTVVGLHHGDGGEPLKTAELVMVCLPPPAIVPWIKAHASDFASGAVVVDICGVKTSIVAEMAHVSQDGWTFVGGHPMAGREVAGYENSLATLFQGASMILTPDPTTPEALLEKLKAYFASVGFAQTVIATPEEHDEMIAFTSQLGHVIATAYSRDVRTPRANGFSAGSFANMTRIASQNAADWSALYLANRTALLEVLDGLQTRLGEFRAALAAGDVAVMKRIIVEGGGYAG